MIISSQFGGFPINVASHPSRRHLAPPETLGYPVYCGSFKSLSALWACQSPSGTSKVLQEPLYPSSLSTPSCIAAGMLGMELPLLPPQPAARLWSWCLGQQHSGRSEGGFVPFFHLLVLLLREWFQAPGGKTRRTLQAALEILHLWFSCCSAGHCHVPPVLGLNGEITGGSRFSCLLTHRRR